MVEIRSNNVECRVVFRIRMKWGLSLREQPWRPRLSFDRFCEPILNPFIKDWPGRVSPLFLAWHPIRRER
jgi:hypothetical protein